jgi:hypothetical protein
MVSSEMWTREEWERCTLSFLMLRAMPDAAPRRVANRPTD